MVDGLNPHRIDTADGVRRVAERCRAAGRFAMDTEADSLHSYFHKVCLIQISADGRNDLIDPLALEAGELAPLWELTGDPAVPVLMHGADYDVRVLDRDYGARIRGLVDTHVMAQLLGEPKTGLSALLERDFGLRLDKKMQRADWGRRPLSARCLDYAAADTAYLEELADRLMHRVDEAGRRSWVEEECARLEEVRHAPSEPDPRAFERIKGARQLKGSARDRLYTLFQWREERAQVADIPPFKILGAAPMLSLAQQAPNRPRRLAAIKGLGPRFVRRWGQQVVELLAHPDAAPKAEPRRRSEAMDPELKKRVKALTGARDQVARSEGLEPGLVCAKALAVAVAQEANDHPPEVAFRRAGLSGWRLELLGERFARVLTEE